MDLLSQMALRGHRGPLFSLPLLSVLANKKKKKKEKTLQPQVCYSLSTLCSFVWGLGRDGTLVVVVVVAGDGEVGG